MLEINKIHNMDCVKGMMQLDDNSIDLVTLKQKKLFVEKQEVQIH